MPFLNVRVPSSVRGRSAVSPASTGLPGATACAFARSMPQLIAARAVQGFGAAGLIPIAMTVSGDIYTLEQRARIQALFSGVWGFAALVGPLIGAFLTVHFGWRSIFSINIPLGAIGFFLVATRMKESRARLADPVDVAGAATLAVGVTLILFAVLHSSAGDAGLSLLPRAALIETVRGGHHEEEQLLHPRPASASFTRPGISLGAVATGMPAASNAVTLDSAVPELPETIAPA